MSDYQFRTILKMILDILKGSKSIEEATEKVEQFLKDKEEIKVIIEWCDEMGHSEHEILDLIRRIVDAKPRAKSSTGDGEDKAES